MAKSDDESMPLDLAEALGASEPASVQVLTVYIADRDRDGNEYGTQRKWVLDIARVLVRIGGGVTIQGPVEGGWLNEQTDNLVWERTILVYTFVRPEQLRVELPNLRTLLHRMGRETGQGEVGVDFDGEFYRIRDFQP